MESETCLDEKSYKGYQEFVFNDIQLAKFYENMEEFGKRLTVNEYLIIRNEENKVVDTYVWTGQEMDRVMYQVFNSKYFGKVKPKMQDVYQLCVMDSFRRNQITTVRGTAGTGKSYLALAYLLSLLESHDVEHIIIFCNTVATINSAKLGYYPGSREEKLLDSSIGNMLSAKFGSRYALEEMIEKEQMILLPMSDIRGYDTSGMNAGVYITEAQNLDITLMKLALQRIGEDSICIIDGDNTSQVDLAQYAGVNNGMARMSKIFRGHDFYGEVELRNVYRSRIAALADKM